MAEIQDPRSGMEENQDPEFGINILDPQHWMLKPRDLPTDSG
jgi:hypothetical protein